MGSITARQTLRAPVLWCDASKLGEFVDFLSGLIEHELVDATEYAKGRAVPRWSISTARRHVTASGPWTAVEQEIPWGRARTVNVVVQGPSTSFDLSSDWGTVALVISASSTHWLDHNIPLIRDRFRRVSPRWTLLFWRPIFVGIGVGTLSTFLTGLSTSSPAALYTALAVLVVCVVLCLIPTVRLGPLPRPLWLRAALTAAGTIAVAVVGAIVGKLMFPA